MNRFYCCITCFIEFIRRILKECSITSCYNGNPLLNFFIFYYHQHVILACPVLVTTFAVYIERKASLHDSLLSRNPTTTRFIFRTITMTCITGIALLIPFFDDFMTFIGSIANTLLIFIFPIVFHFKLFGFKHLTVTELALRCVILVIGCFGGLLGGYQAVKALYNDFTK